MGEPEVEEMIRQQGGLCAICRQNLAEQVDHDHDIKGKVRGVLCDGCNGGLGAFEESPELLTNALQYLQRNQ